MHIKLKKKVRQASKHKIKFEGQGTDSCSVRSGLSKALLDKTIDDLGDSQGAGTKGPAVLRADILEYTGEEDFEHIVHFLFGE